MKLHHAFMAVCCSFIFALQPVGALTVDTGGTADVGTYASAAIVAGRPAIAYQDGTNSDLRYVRASDASGSVWPAPVIVDSANFVGTWACLAVVNGNPAICYYDHSLQVIKYARATDPEGTAWGAPVTVNIGVSVTPTDYSMAVVNGNPAISYHGGPNDDLMYLRATDANGSAWGTPLLVDGNGNFYHPSLRIVGGNPAIAYSGTGGLWYVRASNMSGSAWSAPVNVDGSVGVDYGCSLELVNGNPAIAYHDTTNGDLRYVRAVNAIGSAWGTRVTLDSAGTVGWYPSLAIVNGNPAIGYYTLGPAFDLKYVRATDADGASSLAWGTPVTVDSSGNVGSYASLRAVNGNAAISYYDGTNGDLKFIRATEASGGTQWPADIAIEQPVNTLVPDGGSKSYGTVAIGSAADLVFTVRNPNSGSESLTGLAVTIDGADAAEFAVIAAPAPSVAGGASTSFTVRHSPIVQGLKTAALHLASSVEGSKNPYDIALTAASVPEIVVEQPTGTALADGEARSFAAGPAGSTSDRIFTIKNPGGAPLTGLGIVIDGPNATEFSVVASPAAPLEPGGSTAFTVRFTSASPGGKTAALHLASNVSGSRNPFDIILNAETGTLDPGFDPNIGSVGGIAVQPDGKILLGGSTVRLGLFLADGTREVAFAPTINGLVNGIAVQADGKIVIGGTFNTVGGVTHSRLARLNADGSLDAGFTLNASSDVSCLTLQADGKLLVGGEFTSFGAAGTRLFIARLNADGSLDAGFNPGTNGPVRSIAVQADGKILLGGNFFQVGGVSRNGVARLNSDGSLDAGWNPGVSGEVRSVSVQADGRIVVGGFFTTVGGFFPANRIARLNANGTIDFGFNPNANSSVFACVLQVDGKILVAGGFTTIGGIARNRLARLNADGTLDAAFNPSSSGTVSAVAIQADGKIFVGGGFSTINGTPRNGSARLENDPAPQFLSASGGNRVDWLRAGASPEIEQVSFELSTDGGNTFSALGTATRFPGGWEKSGLVLPASGHLRARGRTAGGLDSGSTGLVETVTAFAAEAPEIAVEQPPGTDLADGGTASFGSVARGDTGSLTFTIKNTGTANLAPLTITKDGTDAAMFTITASPVPVMPGGSTTFTVRFAPTATGVKTAALHIANNDADENPFDLTLTGLGTLSTNADLSGLTLNSGTFTPAFASGTTSYSASVVSSVNKVTFTPTVAQSTATITVNGIAVPSGNTSAPVGLSVGSNLVNIVVTAGNGVTTKTYTIAITRAVPVPGDIEGEFDPGIFTDVLSLAMQPDRKILVGSGNFLNSPLARLQADGTVESTATFNPGTNVSGTIQTLAVQANGKILVGVGGYLDNPIGRLNADGSMESAATFTPGLASNGAVFGMALQSDGKIVLGGGFLGVNGQTRNRIARLQPNGAVESAATFNPGTAADGTIYSVAVQADGKVLLGGQFLNFNGQPRTRIARLNANGTVESTATFNIGTGADSYVYCFAVQPDGKILVGGLFNSINGQPRNHIARLNSNGTLESTATFNPGTGADNPVDGIVLQADGKILLGGGFANVNGQPRKRIARLLADGTLESTATFNFGAGTGDQAGALALQADGKIVVGGNFFYADGSYRGKVARLINGPAIQNITIPDSTRVQWMRGGTAPEVEQVTFELSLNAGQTWSALGAGTRIGGGWERTGLSLPASGSIRARGRTGGGVFNAGSGLIEQIIAFAPYTPLQQWKLTHLGDPNAPDLDDPDRDGLRTLAEYGLNLPPETPGGAPLPVDRFTYTEGERLRVFLQREPAHNDVTIEVQAADSPAGPWSMLAVSTLGAPFSGPGYVSGDDPTPAPKTVEVRDTVNIADAPSRFLRVRVTH